MKLYLKRLKFKICVVLVCICIINSNAQQYSWNQLNDFGGTVRFGTFSFVIGNYGYIGGGYANGINTSDMWQYDPTNGSWTQKSNYPLAIRLSGNFVLDGKGYEICGVIGANTKTNKVYAYDPVNNNWIVKSNFPGVAIFGGASFAIAGKGYFGIGNGGSANGPYYTAFYEYNPLSDVWSQKMTFPGPVRYGTFGIALNGKGYAGLGTDDGLPLTYNDWWEYDPILNTWNQKSFFPGNTRSYPVGFTLNNFIFAGCGGIISSTIYNDFYKYDPVIDSWNTIQSFSGVARWVATGFAIGDTGYIGTGFDGVNYLRDFWQYSPDTTSTISELNDFNFSVYPNPTTGTILMKWDIFDEFRSVELLNINSNTLLNIDLPNFHSKYIQLDLSNYPQGIYFIKINTESKFLVKRILKI